MRGSIRQDDNELHISDVRTTDGGNYVCLAKNSAGTAVLGIAVGATQLLIETKFSVNPL